MEQKDGNHSQPLQKADSPDRKSGLHLWQITAVRDLGLILAAVLGVVVLYRIRSILVPVAIGFGLAYLFRPVVRLAEKRMRLPRVLSAAILLLVVLGLLTAGGFWLVPELIQQLAALQQRLPEYAQTVTASIEWSDVLAESQPSGGSDSSTTQPLTARDFLRSPGTRQLADRLVDGLGRLYGFIGSVVSGVTYAGVAILLVLIFFVAFTVGYDQLDAGLTYVPASRRKAVGIVIAKIDLAFSSYIRGQLAVALWTTTAFCVGFYLTGVPYWFVVSLIGGVLSLIPYGQCTGWVLALLMKYLETQTGDVSFSWFGVILAPSIVYGITQSVETWVITPWAQSEATKLHPLTIIVVLLIGGSVAGILGLVLAIPVTASLRMIFDIFFQDRLKAWADSN